MVFKVCAYFGVCGVARTSVGDVQHVSKSFRSYYTYCLHYVFAQRSVYVYKNGFQNSSPYCVKNAHYISLPVFCFFVGDVQRWNCAARSHPSGC